MRQCVHVLNVHRRTGDEERVLDAGLVERRVDHVLEDLERTSAAAARVQQEEHRPRETLLRVVRRPVGQRLCGVRVQYS